MGVLRYWKVFLTISKLQGGLLHLTFTIPLETKGRLLLR
jgi:hypothetical protein